MIFFLVNFGIVENHKLVELFHTRRTNEAIKQDTIEKSPKRTEPTAKNVLQSLVLQTYLGCVVAAYCQTVFWEKKVLL